ncbi:unnamed protein product [Gadus morhua 'NCC']
MKLRTMCSVISWVFWLVICVQYASSNVPAPVNVSVVCKNFQTVVSWEYSQQVPEPLFRVYIISQTIDSKGLTTVNKTTRDLQYNLTGEVWSDFMSARNLYKVEVSAVSGGQESDRTTSPKLFTFNAIHASVFRKLCTLDLPQVEVLVNGQVATVTFPNPMRIHPELKWAAGREWDPLCLTFDVTENNVTQRGKCLVQNEMCKLDFTLPSKKEKHCLSLNAWLKNDIHKMRFNHKDPTCGRQESVEEPYLLFLALLLALFILVVCSVGFMVWKSKAWFLRSQSLPPTLDPNSWSNLQPNIMDPESERAGFLRANGQSSPSVVITQRPLDPAHGLTEANDQETLSVDLSSESPGDSCPGALYSARFDGSEDDPEEEDPEQEEDEVECEPELEYDRPHFPSLDMGDRDMVHTYGL